MEKKTILAGSLVAAALISTSVANASTNAFAFDELGSGADVRTNLMETPAVNGFDHELKCGEKSKEAKCGEKAKEAKCGEKGKEAKCGEHKAKDAKCGEGKCGEKGKEAKCGEHKAKDAKCGEGKCGEGKCGEKK